MPTDAVHNWDAIKPFLDAARTRRVGVAGIGDSNQFKEGDSGWRQGMELALAQAFGAWGGGLMVFPGSGSWISGQNGLRADNANVNWNTNSAPSELTSLVPTEPGFQSHKYGYIADSESFSSSFGDTNDRTALTIVGDNDSPPSGQLIIPDISAELKWHLVYGTFPSTAGTGSFRPATRVAGSFTHHVIDDAIDPTAADQYGLAVHTLTKPGNTWFDGNTFYFEIVPLDNGNNNNPLEGPGFFCWQKLEQSNVSAGIDYQTLLYQGGLGTVEAAQALQNTTDTQLGNWLRYATYGQSGDPTLLVQIKHGGNDRNDDGTTSVGPNPTNSALPDGFADNLHAVYNRIQEAWIAEGFKAGNLYFLFGAYHPQDGDQTIDGTTKSKVQWLNDYYEAASDLSDNLNNTAVLFGNRLITVQEMLNNPDADGGNGWYDGQGGDAHLDQNGYEGFADLEVDALRTARNRTIGGPFSASMG